MGAYIGTVNSISVVGRNIKLIRWRMDDRDQWCITLRQLADVVGLNYRPKQMLTNRLKDKNFIYVTYEDFNSRVIWEYSDIFDRKDEYLINQIGVIELLMGSKKDKAKMFLDQLLTVLNENDVLETYR